MDLELITKAGLTRSDLMDAYLILNADLERVKKSNVSGELDNIIAPRAEVVARFKTACGL